MDYLCEVCGKKITGDSFVFIDHTEKHIVDLIKKKHPEWVEKNGICHKCLEYYKEELKGLA